MSSLADIIFYSPNPEAALRRYIKDIVEQEAKAAVKQLLVGQPYTQAFDLREWFEQRANR